MNDQKDSQQVINSSTRHFHYIILTKKHKYRS